MLGLFARDALRRERKALRRPRTHIRAGIRAMVLAAGKCAICGATERLQVDHRLPLARGGDNTFANLQALCARCNRWKGMYGTNETVAARLKVTA